MKRKKKEYLECAAFTVPSLFLVMLVFYIPFVMSLYYSLTEWNGISKAPKFIGLENFKKLFSGSSDFMQSLIFTGKYTIIFMILVNILALAIAVALVQKIPAANVMRSMFFIPYIMSMTIVGFIWKFIFSQGFAALFEKTHLGFLNLSWLGDSHLAFYAVAFVGIWQALGFYIVLYIAGLQAIPEDIQEAAMIDGANRTQRLFRVTIQNMMPSITICTFLTITNSFKLFDQNLALTGGEPLHKTEMLALNIYETFYGRVGYEGVGQAKAVIFFILVVVIGLIQLKLTRSKEVQQ